MSRVGRRRFGRAFAEAAVDLLRGATMQMPDVKSTIRDEQHNVTYHVLAYRPLSRSELVESVRVYHAQPKVRRRKKPIKDRVITIVTIHGATAKL